jgi:hypothetical protein
MFVVVIILVVASRQELLLNQMGSLQLGREDDAVLGRCRSYRAMWGNHD